MKFRLTLTKRWPLTRRRRQPGKICRRWRGTNGFVGSFRQNRKRRAVAEFNARSRICRPANAAPVVGPAVRIGDRARRSGSRNEPARPPGPRPEWIVGVILSFAYMVRLQRAFMSSLGPLSGSARVLRAQSSAGCPVLVGIFEPSVILPRDFK